MIWTDLSLDKNKKLINEKFEFLLQEISILFDTNPGEVLGEHNFGTDFEKYIWDLNVSNAEISNYVKRVITTQTISGSLFDISVDTKILYGTQHDIILVTISIRDPETDQVQKITYNL